jgi:hypothetical protein
VIGLIEALGEYQLTSLFPEVLKQLGDLVSVHTGSRYLDRASPVEVVVTQIEGKLLNNPLSYG